MSTLWSLEAPRLRPPPSALLGRPGSVPRRWPRPPCPTSRAVAAAGQGLGSGRVAGSPPPQQYANAVSQLFQVASGGAGVSCAYSHQEAGAGVPRRVYVQVFFWLFLTSRADRRPIPKTGAAFIAPLVRPPSVGLLLPFCISVAAWLPAVPCISGFSIAGHPQKMNQALVAGELGTFKFEFCNMEPQEQVSLTQVTVRPLSAD